MILKVFKEKSNQKYINKTLSTRKVIVNDSKIKTIGVILNSEEFSDFEAFRNFFKSLQLQPNNTKIIALLQDSLESNEHWDTYFDLNDFGWKGRFKNLDLQTFVDKKFDLLISYYKTQHLELNMITAASKASFKVGLSNEDQRFYDLIIDCEPKDFSTFIIELNKYLTVLNKI
jgi:hypothetical protein